MSPLRISLLVFATLVAAPGARADVLILVAPSVGPNVFNSPNYDAYRDNSLSALQSGASTAGTPGTPSFYQTTPNGGSVPVSNLVVTDFPSWLGRADPASAFGPQFGGESGTRLYFGLSILPVAGTPSTPFRISDLSFNATTTDPNQTLDFGFPTGDYEYSTDYVGLIFNPNGTVTQVTSGPNTQLVDGLIGRGSSNAFEVLSSDPGATNQDKINQALPANGFSFTGTYTLGNQTGSATVTATAVPVPPSCVLIGIGFAGLAIRRYRTR